MASLADFCPRSRVYYFLDEPTMNILLYGRERRANWVFDTRGYLQKFDLVVWLHFKAESGAFAFTNVVPI